MRSTGEVHPVNKILGTAFSYDDVLLVPRRSGVLPDQVDTTSAFTPSIRLEIPIVSAAMDTVTEARMAIALARQGGIGVVHKRQSIDDQVRMVRQVKRSESGTITDPVTVTTDATLQDAEDLMAHYRISGVPVVHGDNVLAGIITNRDLRFETDFSRPVTERMTAQNLVTAKVGTDLEMAKETLREHRIEKLLLVDDDGRLAGLITIKDLQKAIDYPRATKDEQGRLRAAAALGVSADLHDRAGALVEAGVDALVLDSAHGHSEGILDALVAVKERYDVEVVGGNVATADGARDLVERGADAVKVGIGPGSICTTRVVTGVGVPQLTAVLECVQAAGDVPVIADGGIKQTGDVAKALAAGAGTVMIGSMFAGTYEAPGEEVLHEGRRFKTYRGMGSLAAMSGESSSADRYFQDPNASSKLVPEGVEGMVPYRGPMGDIVHQIVGGVRSAMGYCGAPDMATFGSATRFHRITQAALRESHPHDIRITREAPNYTTSD
nr:IMP dehydrogenase [Salsipaludibacter albus]